MLTPGRGPTTDRDKLEQLKRDNPAEVHNANWDPRRLWLTSYKEADRTVKIGGLARDGEDVSELERRLKLSDYFSDVKLLPGSKIDGRADASGALPVRAQREGEVLTMATPAQSRARQAAAAGARSASAPRVPRSSCVRLLVRLLLGQSRAKIEGAERQKQTLHDELAAAAAGAGQLLRRPRRARAARAAQRES